MELENPVLGGKGGGGGVLISTHGRSRIARIITVLVVFGTGVVVVFLEWDCL